MAQFIIDLPYNRQGNVKTGVMRKEKSFADIFFPWKKINREEKLAYIVLVEPGYDINEYRLLKTKEGKWLEDGEDKWLREGESTFSLAIKKAIDDYENLQRKKRFNTLG